MAEEQFHNARIMELKIIIIICHCSSSNAKKRFEANLTITSHYSHSNEANSTTALL